MKKLLIMIIFSVGVISGANIRDAKVKEIINGNTFIVRQAPYKAQVYYNSSFKKPKIVHLYGIYTPPENTVVAEKARQFLIDEILDKRVDVFVEKKIDNQNVIGKVRAPGIRDLSRELVKLGLAKVKDDKGKYLKEQEKAQRKKIGLWAKDNESTNEVENLYANNVSASEWSYYKLKLSGYDSFYKLGEGPNKYLIYHKNRARKVLSQYVLIGIDPHKLDMLRNGETDYVVVQVIGKQGIRFPSGKIKYFPKLKVVGKNTVHGVGGELMYYK